MVRNKVENLAEAIGCESGEHALERLARTDLGVELGVADNVLAVTAARPGAKIGRSIDMAYSELAQIRGDFGASVEAEVVAELQPIGGSGNRARGSTFRGRGWRLVRNRPAA